MAKHAKPKQTLRNATLTVRGQRVVDFFTMGGILAAVAIISALIERIG